MTRGRFYVIGGDAAAPVPLPPGGVAPSLGDLPVVPPSLSKGRFRINASRIDISMIERDHGPVRTTIDIHDPLLERAKQLARSTGRRLADVVNDALREMLARRDALAAQSDDAAPMPISRVRGRGVNPRLDITDTASLLDEIDGLTGRSPDDPASDVDALR